MPVKPVIALAAIALLGATACGDETGRDPAGLGPAADGAGGGDVPITARAVAAVALVHLPEDTSSRQATYQTYVDAPGTMGADLRYGAGPAEDGDLVSVLVSPEVPRRPCPRHGPCERREVDGGELVLTWQEFFPEEDPGYVSVRLVREDEVVSVGYSGPNIEGDPREQDLPIDVEVLEDVVLDPRLSVTTDQDVVDAGEKLGDWDGGEQADTSDPTPEPATDQHLIGFALAYLHVTGWDATGPTKVRPAFGRDAVATGLWRRADRAAPYEQVDVVVAPRRPSWLADDPCSTPGYQCRSSQGKTGEQVLLWQPGPDGEVWALGLRDDEVVAFRFSGWRVPETATEVDAQVDVQLVRRLMDDDVHLGLMSTRGMTGVQF